MCKVLHCIKYHLVQTFYNQQVNNSVPENKNNNLTRAKTWERFGPSSKSSLLTRSENSQSVYVV